MRKVLSYLLILFLSTGFLFSQSAEEVRHKQDSLNLYPHKVGAYFNYNMNQYSSNFSTLTGIPFCNREFTSGSGSGIAGGLFYEYPFTKKLSIIARLGFNQLNGSFASDDFTTVNPTGDNPVQAKFEYQLDAYLSAIEFSPIISYKFYHLAGDLSFNIGPNLSFLMGKTFDQREKIVEPAGVPFNDGNFVRNEQNGVDIPNANALQYGALLGLSWELPMGSGLKITPEIYYAMNFSKVADVDWSVNQLRFGASVKYELDRPCPPGMFRNADGNCEWIPCPPDMIRNEDGLCACRPGMFVNENGNCEWPPCDERNYQRNDEGKCVQVMYADVNPILIDDNGQEKPANEITVKEFPATISQPLLNAVFFEEGKAEIPTKYKQFANSDQTDNFSETKVADPDNILKTYYSVLNIIGHRMTTNIFSNVTLVSYNMGKSESNYKDLASKRTKAISNYLKNIWKIPDYRIKEQVYNLPIDIAETMDKTILDENRKVDIIPDSASINILLPIVIKARVNKTQNPKIKFNFDILPMTKLKKWDLSLSQDKLSIFDTTGNSSNSKYFVWNTTNYANKLNSSIDYLNYSLYAKDNNGKDVKTDKKLNINWIHYSEDRPKEAGDSSFAIYSYLFNHKVIARDLRKNSILIDKIEFNEFTSKFNVEGYCDVSGNKTDKISLANKRTDAVVNYLVNIKEIKENLLDVSKSKAFELFDNSLPEGRIYNRTVIVKVSTPIEKKVKQRIKVSGCFVIIYSDEKEVKAKSILDYLKKNGINDAFIELYTPEFEDKTYYRVRTKLYKEVKGAARAIAKINYVLKPLNLTKPASIKCEK